jgi:transcriptional regulator with XRE-family HTH domain
MISKKDKAFLQKFGMHLRKLREKRGLSLRDLSYLCDIDNSKISKMEQGKINITLRTVLQLSEAFELPPMELLNFHHGN